MSGDPPALELAVLAHLRGYPEELQRFSNVMKQAHTDGRGTAEFFLSRPAAADSFLAAICRFVLAGEPIVTIVEAAGLLRVPPSTALDLADAPTFPRPVWGEGRHRLWRRADIAALPRAPLEPPVGGSGAR